MPRARGCPQQTVWCKGDSSVGWCSQSDTCPRASVSLLEECLASIPSFWGQAERCPGLLVFGRCRGSPCVAVTQHNSVAFSRALVIVPRTHTAHFGWQRVLNSCDQPPAPCLTSPALPNRRRNFCASSNICHSSLKATCFCMSLSLSFVFFFTLDFFFFFFGPHRNNYKYTTCLFEEVIHG